MSQQINGPGAIGEILLIVVLVIGAAFFWALIEPYVLHIIKKIRVRRADKKRFKVAEEARSDFI